MVAQVVEVCLWRWSYNDLSDATRWTIAVSLVGVRDQRPARSMRRIHRGLTVNSFIKDDSQCPSDEKFDVERLQ